VSFLDSLPINVSQAEKIRRRYGGEVEAIVSADPYRLIEEIEGVGFVTADAVARSLGIGPDSAVRVEAAVRHALRECAAEGHVYFPRVPLIQRSQKLLEIDRELIHEAIDRLVDAGELVLEGREEGLEERVYLRSFHAAECRVADALVGMQKGVGAWDAGHGGDAAGTGGDADTGGADAAAWAQESMDVPLAERQLAAIRSAMASRVTVITGGPGTGKTTVIRALLAVLEKAGRSAILAAPTGRGARRMAEATGREAATVHRLLEYNPRGGFKRNRRNPLVCDWLILDESSMMDLKLTGRLLDALPAGASLVLVGDVNQLPSIGAGQVLRDVIRSRRFAVVELNQVFRQADASRITLNAHRVQVGLMPEMDPDGDFFLVRRAEPDAVVRIIVELCRARIPRRFQLDGTADVQVLTPMNRGPAGVGRLNRELQAALNPGEGGGPAAPRGFREADKVMQTRNNYEKGVFNGDIGRITALARPARRLVVSFEERDVEYGFDELGQLSLAYAVTVHKAQGSEFPAVVLPLVMQHYPMLERNLLYTAITRARRLAVLVGDERALAAAVRSNDTRRRYSHLESRLAAAGEA